MMPSSSGIYGLFRLDGGPVDAADAAIFGLPVIDAPGMALAKGVDTNAPDAIQRKDADGRITLLAGYLDEPEALADRLAMDRAAPPADLARAALLRFGAETPAVMLGEWTMLHWEPTGQLILIASAARRDRMFFAINGQRCAVAPDLAALARIGWVDDDIDAAGLLYGVGRKTVRAHRGASTMLKGVRQLGPADCVTIADGRVRRETAVVLTPQPRWRGTFHDAVAETETLLRRMMCQRAARTAKPAVLLSGGLDSSLLAWLVDAERAPDQRLGFITSAAPPGSDIPDESEFADIVAASLGLTIDRVAPPLEADTYRPSDHVIAGADGPLLSSRHCLTEAFHVAARGQGATELVNGCYGEFSVTGRPPVVPLKQRLRAMARDIVRGPAEVEDEGPFHVRIAPGRLARLPDDIRDAAAAPQPVAKRRRGDSWGYTPGVQTALEQSNAFYAGALRMDFPYRDLRLLRLFAGMPLAFAAHRGVDRASARHILDGRLPDAIRLRRTGMPASPDHIVRLRRQARAARGRIATFRRADIDEWFDLDWLDQALERIAAHGPRHVGDANEVQLTAINAEMLTWWRTRR